MISGFVERPISKKVCDGRLDIFAMHGYTRTKEADSLKGNCTFALSTKPTVLSQFDFLKRGYGPGRSFDSCNIEALNTHRLTLSVCPDLIVLRLKHINPNIPI